MQPSVSVIIPAYNSAKTLRACLDSAFAQTHPPVEVIVVDDASTDESPHIAREFPTILLRRTRNAGPAACRNAGIRKSSGEILFFVDSDGALDRDAVSNAVAILIEDPTVGCVHGNYRTEPLFDDGRVELYKVLHSHFWRRRGMGRVRSVFFAMCAVRREVFDEVGLLDENLRASEDVEFADRMADRFGIVLTSRVSGRHDADSRLWAMLWKQFLRSQLLLPVALAERGPAGLRANRPAGLMFAALTVATLPLGLVAAPLFALPLACLCAFALADVPLARFVTTERGLRFVCYFMAVHFLVQLAIVSGAIIGALRHLLDRDFGPSRSATAGSRP